MLLTKPYYIALSLLSFSLSTYADAATDKVTAAIDSAASIAFGASSYGQVVDPRNSVFTVPELLKMHQQLDDKLRNGASSISEQSTIIINIEIGGPSKRLKQSRLSTLAPSDSDQEAVLESWQRFGRAMDALLEVETAKASFLSPGPFGPQIRKALQTNQISIGIIRFLAEDLTPTYKDGMKKVTDELNKAMIAAETAYKS